MKIIVRVCVCDTSIKEHQFLKYIIYYSLTSSRFRNTIKNFVLIKSWTMDYISSEFQTKNRKCNEIIFIRKWFECEQIMGMKWAWKHLSTCENNEHSALTYTNQKGKHIVQYAVARTKRWNACERHT